MSFVKLWILPDILWNIPSHKGTFGFTDTINSPFPLFTSATTCEWKAPHMFIQCHSRLSSSESCFTINWVLCLFHLAIEVKLSLQSLLTGCPQSNPKSTDLLPCIQLAKLKRHAIQAAMTCQLFPLHASWKPNSTPAPLFYTVWLYQWYFSCHWCLLCPVSRRSSCCLVHSQ